jgi:hypothetical protein
MGITIIFFIFIAIIGLIGAASIDNTHGKQHTVGASLAVLFTAGICIAALILSVSNSISIDDLILFLFR